MLKMRLPVILATVPALAATALIAGVASADDLDWTECGTPPAECTTVTVPRDWDDPDGDSLELQVARRPADDQHARRGVLFFNPGGPGTGAAGYIAAAAEETFSPDLLEHYDIVGVDPRGVAGSPPIECDLPVRDPAVTQFPADETEYQTLLDYNRSVADSCDDLIADVDSLNVARDHDAVRQLLGEDTVSFFGKSYGSMLGTAYAELFPNRISAMVLDSVVDHSMSTDEMVVQAAAAVENSFNDFARRCETTPDCRLYGEDVGVVWDDLMTAAETAPIPVPGGEPMTATELRDAAYVFLNVSPGFDEMFVAAIIEAADGEATLFDQIRREAAADPYAGYAYRAVLCLDIDPAIDGYDDMAHRMERVRAVAPHMGGGSEFWDMTAGCLGWPIEPTNPQRDIDITEVPPVLLVGNTFDPATPAHWADSLSEGFDGSRVLIVEGPGHTAYLRSTCATDQIDVYLTAGELPDPGTACSIGG